MTQDLRLAAWHDAVRQGSIAGARRSATLTFFDSEGAAVARYFLESAWPSKLEISGTPSGKSGQPLTEKVTLVSEFIMRIAP